MSVVVHVGQCGNQLGDAFWRLAADTSDSTAPTTGTATAPPPHKKSGATNTPARSVPPPQRVARPLLSADSLFHRASRRARCILVDTEPKVVNAMLRNWNFHASAAATGWRFEPAHVHLEQSGRGNNWAMGFNLQTHQRNVVPSTRGVSLAAISTNLATSRSTKKKLQLAADAHATDARELVELVMESLRHEIEAVDTYRGTMLMHSLGGGTGAGLGCRLLQTIRDVYPRSYLGAVSVAPSCARGDTPLQNYNALFTLQHLQEHTDWVVYKENDELLKTALYWKSVVGVHDTDDSKQVTLREMNALVATDIAGLVFPLVRKFGDRGNVAQPFDMAKLVHDCCPLPTVKFLDTRTGVSLVTSKKAGAGISGAADPLFHGVPPSHASGDDPDSSVSKLLRHTTQAFPRSTSASRAIAASAVIRYAPGTLEDGRRSDEYFAKTLTAAGLPRLHLGNSVHVAQSQFAPFQSYRGKAAVTVTLNSGHAITSINHFLDRGRRQFQARAYTHWYKQYGLEDADFENAFEASTRIVQQYEEMLHP